MSFWERISHWPRTRQVGEASCPVSPRDPPGSISPVLNSPAHTTTPSSLYTASGNQAQTFMLTLHAKPSHPPAPYCWSESVHSTGPEVEESSLTPYQD